MEHLAVNIFLTYFSGLVPTFVAVIDYILVPLRKMQLTQSEYVLLQAIILFDPGWLFDSRYFTFNLKDILLECPSLSESGREMVAAERRIVISSLKAHCWSTRLDALEAAHRLGALLLRIVSINVSNNYIIFYYSWRR